MSDEIKIPGVQFGPNWKYGQDCIEVTASQPQPDAPIDEYTAARKYASECFGHAWGLLDGIQQGIICNIVLRKMWADGARERAEAALTQVREALSNSADQTLNDASKCYCLEERLAKGYEYGEVGGEHQPWCDNARAALAATKE